MGNKPYRRYNLFLAPLPPEMGKWRRSKEAVTKLVFPIQEICWPGSGFGVKGLPLVGLLSRFCWLNPNQPTLFGRC